MKQRLLSRAAPCLALTVLTFAALLPLTPVPEKGEALVMVSAFALLAGATLYFAAGFLPSYLMLGAVAAALLAGMILRTLGLTHQTTDYVYCLKPWAQSFRDEGWRAIASTWSDYNVPYLYFIGIIADIPMNDLYLYKLLSVIFDCCLIVAGLRLAQVLKFPELRKTILAAALFLAPTVWLNSAIWGQCDAVYALFCILALTFALENRPVLSVIMAAVAFAFKLQAIFLLPIFAVLWFSKRVRLRHIPVFIGAFFLTLLPALFMGRSLISMLSIYGRQAEQYSSRLNLNSPSAYALLWSNEPHDLLFNAGLILAFCYLGVLLLVAWLNRTRLTDKSIFLFALAMVIGIPWLLPSMHERYFYLADLLCIVLALLIPEKWYFAPYCVFCSYAGYHAYLFNTYLPWVGLIGPSLIMLFLMGSSVVLLVNELKMERCS